MIALSKIGITDWIREKVLFHHESANFSVDERAIERFRSSSEQIYDMITDKAPQWNPEPPSSEEWSLIDDSAISWKRVELDKVKHLAVQMSGSSTQLKTRVAAFDILINNLSAAPIRVWVNGVPTDIDPSGCFSIQKGNVFKVDLFTESVFLMIFFDYFN